MNSSQVVGLIMLLGAIVAVIWFYRLGKQVGQSEALKMADPYEFLQDDYLRASRVTYVVRKDFKLGYLTALNRYMSTQGKAAAGYEADAEAFDKP